MVVHHVRLPVLLSVTPETQPLDLQWLTIVIVMSLGVLRVATLAPLTL